MACCQVLQEVLLLYVYLPRSLMNLVFSLLLEEPLTWMGFCCLAVTVHCPLPCELPLQLLQQLLLFFKLALQLSLLLQHIKGHRFARCICRDIPHYGLVFAQDDVPCRVCRLRWIGCHSWLWRSALASIWL